jgi:chromatin remodeling complex protein RSC6
MPKKNSSSTNMTDSTVTTPDTTTDTTPDTTTDSITNLQTEVEEKMSESDIVFSQMTNTLEMVNKLQLEMKDITINLKSIQKFLVKAGKTSSKKNVKKILKDKKPPSGFAKPTKISDELADFLEIEKGSFLPRTEVTRLIHQYVVKNGLRDENDKRHITPDDNLKKILNNYDKDVTYFNLQSFVKHHFIKE